MTYEEREKELCRECNRKETCPYIPRKMEYKCQHLSDMMYGWELGHKDATDKACEWLKYNFNMPNDFEYYFKKAMEEQ